MQQHHFEKVSVSLSLTSSLSLSLSLFFILSFSLSSLCILTDLLICVTLCSHLPFFFCACLLVVPFFRSYFSSLKHVGVQGHRCKTNVMFDWRAERLLGVFCRRFLAFYRSSRQFDQVSFSLGAFSKMFTCYWSNGNDKYWSTRCVIYSFNHTQLNCFDYACEKWSSFCQQIWSVRCVF